MKVNDIKIAPEYEAFLREWTDNLGVSVEVLLARIVIDTAEGHLYVEKIPDYYPVPNETERSKRQRT